jgi:S1-C subfamily serine protease
VRRAWLGIAGLEVLLPKRLERELGLAAARGVAVQRIERGSPAARAGLQPRDVLVALGGAPIASVADLLRLLDASAIGAERELTVVRDGRKLALVVRPAEAPPQPVA